MAIDIGTVKGEEITTNKDGDDNVRLLQVELSNPDDLQTIEHVRQPGDDSGPIEDSRVIMVDLGASYRVAIAFDDGIEPSAAQGEKILYSVELDRGTWVKTAIITLASDGTITIENDESTITMTTNGDITLENSSSGIISVAGSGAGAPGLVDINGNLTVAI